MPQMSPMFWTLLFFMFILLFLLFNIINYFNFNPIFKTTETDKKNIMNNTYLIWKW